MTRRGILFLCANTSAYIVWLPKSKATLSGGFGSGAQYVQLKNYCFDGAASELTPPTKGNVTTRQPYKAVQLAYVAYTETFT